jgi:hypothetical protein
MELFNPRKLKFKAWNVESKLLMRLNSIDCVKGELNKKNHILLQFTGLYDKQGEELYDMDILVDGMDKYLIQWSNEVYGWAIIHLESRIIQNPIKNVLEKSIRLRSYFESAS